MEEISIILVLILLNGLFALSEIALISARKSSLSKDAHRGSRTARIALKLANEPERFLSTIQIGITSIGILTGIYSGDVLAGDFSVVLSQWGVAPQYAHPIAQTVIVVLVTYLSIILGELVPKRIGMTAAEKMSRLMAYPMYGLSVIASPFVWLLSKSTTSIFNLLGMQPNENKVTEEEVKMIVKEGTDGGEIQEVEQDIVERVFLMGDLKVESIMTHRSEVVSMKLDMTLPQIKQQLQEDVFEVYPVADGDLDKISGVVHLKDLIAQLDKEDFRLEQIIQPACYFYENMSVYKALEQMREKQTSYALICNEFGDFQGIITYRDILEGLIGSVDSTTERPEIVKRTDAEGWLVDGQYPFHDFLSFFDMEDLYATNKYSTLGGLILNQLEHIPTTGEMIRWKGFTFEIMDMDGVRIDKVLVNT